MTAVMAITIEHLYYCNLVEHLYTAT